MSKNSFTIDNPAEKGWIEDEDGRWIWSGSSYPNAEDLEVDTRHVLLDSASKSMLPAGVSTQSDANRVVLAHLDTIFDEVGEIGDLHTKGNVQAADFLDSEGNSIIGGGEAENPFDMDAVGTATQKITLPEGALDNPGEEADIGVGHIYEVGSDFGDFTYYFKKEGLENIHGNVGDEVYENPFYWMTGD